MNKLEQLEEEIKLFKMGLKSNENMVEALEYRLKELKEEWRIQGKEDKLELWKPHINDFGEVLEGLFINSNGTIRQVEEFSTNKISEYLFYNCFETETQAEYARQKLLEILFFCSFKASFEEEGEIHLPCSLYFDEEKGSWILVQHFTEPKKYSGIIFFSKDCALKCLDYCNKHFPDGVIKERKL